MCQSHMNHIEPRDSATRAEASIFDAHIHIRTPQLRLGPGESACRASSDPLQKILRFSQDNRFVTVVSAPEPGVRRPEYCAETTWWKRITAT